MTGDTASTKDEPITHVLLNGHTVILPRKCVYLFPYIAVLSLDMFLFIQMAVKAEIVILSKCEGQVTVGCSALNSAPIMSPTQLRTMTK